MSSWQLVPGNRWDLLEPAAPPTVTVVVAHYEQPAQLARTLTALERQDHAVDQVVVSDDGSATPPSVPPHVRLVRQEDRGFRAAAARNLGAAATTGPVLTPTCSRSRSTDPSATRPLSPPSPVNPSSSACMSAASDLIGNWRSSWSNVARSCDSVRAGVRSAISAGSPPMSDS